MPSLHRRRAARGSAPACLELDLAAVEEVALDHARDDLEGLGPAGADQAEDAGDLARIDRKELLLHHRRHGAYSAPTARAARRGRTVVLRRAVELVATGRGRPWRGRSSRGRICLASSVTTCLPSRRTVIRSASQRLLQRVGDEDDRDAAPLEFAHQSRRNTASPPASARPSVRRR